MMSKPKVLFIGDLDESLPQFHQFKENYEPLVIGYDAYDTEALKSKNIQFFNTPSLGADHVADLVLWHVLESFRRFSSFQKETQNLPHTVKVRSDLQSHGYDQKHGKLGTEQTQWERESYPFGHILGGQVIEGPSGRNVGLVGFGNIGQKIGKRLNALGMKISYHTRNELSSDDVDKLGFGVQFYKKIDDLVSQNDVVIICCPGNKSTLNLLNKDILDKAKPNSKFINVGRGFIIDEDHLITKLEKGEIGFIGLDVFTGEPVINPRLLNRPDVSLTPHIGSSTKDVFDNTAIFSLQNIVDSLQGKEGRSRIV
ncbi:Glyoxylate reductase [Wickerhamomyces ciferrii]|uniref:Glyoxylate reductase n=1 Tax=Wickerhamomyces ciferrii (strain ATCC 14091 / BCRC 22168 / CBS 111 / JCM 3599 / NBRC 0793 / NRRL Y-1031 F-60-10) TaxID=1206466 RepID=K0KEQ8_WICCF|nr:Glyoxylate reductase [Wickerhamomyces ciferrii]CCH41416.1 Glyoxylate reductase [Wickerhamomyces ciferrii]